jgi:hypothetical protein
MLKTTWIFTPFINVWRTSLRLHVISSHNIACKKDNSENMVCLYAHVRQFWGQQVKQITREAECRGNRSLHNSPLCFDQLTPIPAFPLHKGKGEI